MEILAIVVIVVIVLPAILTMSLYSVFTFFEIVEYAYYTISYASLKKKLSASTNFHSLFVGHGSHYINGQMVFSDAPLLMIIKHGNQPVGMVGFSTLGKALKVIQMQGLKKAKLHGINFDQWMIDRVEELAMILGFSEVRIIKARFQAYYKKDNVPLRRRMQRRYDQTPRSRKYNRTAIRFWAVKILRSV
jgi:hypothetical protein